MGAVRLHFYIFPASFVLQRTEKPSVAGLYFFGIAFAFKLQAIFFAPLLLLLCIKNRLWLRHLLTIPAVYLLSILPAWIAGRNFWDLLTIYFNQAGQYHNLSKNAPNVWSFLASRQDSGLSLFGIMLAGAAVIFLLYFLWERCRTLSDDTLLTAALAFLLAIPFFLPHMHERYFFPADVFAILYALNKPKRFPVPLLVIGASTVSYLPFFVRRIPGRIDNRRCVDGCGADFCSVGFVSRANARRCQIKCASISKHRTG